MTFSEVLDNYLQLRKQGSQDLGGYTDKEYHRSLASLRTALDQLAPGEADPVISVPIRTWED